MTALWDIASGWYASAGLTSDFVGVLVLAADILPEYRRWLRHSAARTAQAAVAKVLALSPEDQAATLHRLEPGADVDPYLAAAQGVTEVVGRNPFYVADMTLGRAAQAFGRQLPGKARGKAMPEALADLRAREQKLLLMVSEDHENARLDRPRRPPIILGLLLIAIGFLLQLVAALPI